MAARGQKTLADMVNLLRAEIGQSLQGGQGTNMTDTLRLRLANEQEQLYAEHDWPQFIIDEQVSVAAGSRYLTGLTNIDEEQVNCMWCQEGSTWVPMEYGINPEHYSLYSPENNIQSFPVLRYKYDDLNNGLEIWPLPSIDTEILVRGQRKLPALTADADTSLLNGQLIVYYTAARILARQKSEDAPLLLSQADRFRRAIMMQNNSDKHKPRSMGRPQGGRRPRPGLDYIPRGFGS